jgi:hypothetical protein
MYALVRRYEGVDPGDIDQVVRQVDAGFVPILEQAHGFQGYWAIKAEEGVVVSVTLFDDRKGAEDSQRQAAGFVRDHLAALLPKPPQVSAGEVVVARAPQQVGTPTALG